MSNSLTHSLPYPVKNARFSLPLSFVVAAGTPTDPTTPDTEFSIDGGASFTDCAEEITTGGTNGLGYLTLTGAETNNSQVLIAAKSANCVTTRAVVIPRVLPILLSGTAQAGAAGSITLASGTGVYSLAGAIVRTTGGTGGGGTGGANNQARVITAFNTSTKVATVSPNWETTPDNTTTYDILLTEMCPAAVEIAFTNDTDTAAALAAQTASVWQDTTAGNYTVASSIGKSVMNGVALGTGLTVASVSGNVGGISGTITTLDTLKTQILTTALTESYAADGAAPTLSQFCFMVWADLHEFAISGTTMTAKKLDKSTTAFTHTLDSSTSPTSKTRAT